MLIFQFSRGALVSPDLSKKTRILPVQIFRNEDALYYKTKTRGDIFKKKGISEQFC